MYELIFKVYRRLKGIFLFPIYKLSFKEFGRKSTIFNPDILQGMRFTSIGKKTYIQPGLWLLALKIGDDDPILKIGSNVYVGRYAHIVSVHSVVICDNVLIADKVYISDNLHEFSRIDMPIKDQPVLFKNTVTIHEGAWLGENVCIIGASVGKNSVVAANSVVTKDVPDYTVVAGTPARIIKIYNHESSQWESV